MSYLKRRKVVLNKAAMRVSKNMKYGISISAIYDESVELDRINVNTYSKDTTKKEMKIVGVAFKFIDYGSKLPIGFNRITCHINFDVKFYLTRKTIYVGCGHPTQVPASMSYSIVVSRNSVIIILLIAALNDLDIKMCCVGNAYLNAETRERLWLKAGYELLS